MSYFKDDLLIFLLLHGPYYMKLIHEHLRVLILFFIILLFLERSLKRSLGYYQYSTFFAYDITRPTD